MWPLLPSFDLITGAVNAQVAFLGFIGQHAATGQSPLQALSSHVQSPWGSNFATNGVSLPF